MADELLRPDPCGASPPVPSCGAKRNATPRLRLGCGAAFIVALIALLTLSLYVVISIPTNFGLITNVDEMDPTLKDGDRVVYQRDAAFRLGAMVVIQPAAAYDDLPDHLYPQNGSLTTLGRVVAIEGQELTLVDGRLFINAWSVPHCYVGKLSTGAHAYVEFLGSSTYLTQYERPLRRRPCADEGVRTEQRGCVDGFAGYVEGPYRLKAGDAWLLGDARGFGGTGCTGPFVLSGRTNVDELLGSVRAAVDWSTSRPVFRAGPRRPRLAPADAALRPALERCLDHPPAVTLPPAVATRRLFTTFLKPPPDESPDGIPWSTAR